MWVSVATLFCPESIVLDSAGRVYVASFSDEEVHEYDANGNPLASFDTSPLRPLDATVTPNGRLYWGGANAIGGGAPLEVGIPRCYGVQCPCGNDDPGAGCVYSTGAGGFLTGQGTPSIGADDLELFATHLPLNNNGLFYMGDAQAQSSFFDGRQCALGTTFRFLGSIQNSGPLGQMQLGTGIVAAAGGLIQSGTT